MVVPVTPGAAIKGPNGWCYGGWTAPAPGSHHFPEVKGGALIAFFFLPAGRISYAAQPDAVPGILRHKRDTSEARMRHLKREPAC